MRAEKSNTAVYDGEDLIANNDDVLLVTINYRTNIFGFPGAPQLSGRPLSQNFGALDVDTAIQWVYKNIAGFGGDPERITIFGQSAGSAMVSTYPFWKGPDTPVKGEYHNLLSKTLYRRPIFPRDNSTVRKVKSSP